MEEYAVETIFYIVLVEPWRTKPRVGVTQERQESVQGASKLHGFWRGVRYCGLVYQVPVPKPQMVAEEAGLAVSFVFDCGGREHDLF